MEQLWTVLATRAPELFIVFLIVVYFVRSLNGAVTDLTQDIKDVHKELVDILKENHIRMTKWESYFVSVEDANKDLKIIVADLGRIVVQIEKDRARQEGYMVGQRAHQWEEPKD